MNLFNLAFIPTMILHVIFQSMHKFISTYDEKKLVVFKSTIKFYVGFQTMFLCFSIYYTISNFSNLISTYDNFYDAYQSMLSYIFDFNLFYIHA